MFEIYERLHNKHKGFVQITVGMAVVLYIVGIFPYWIALLASLALVAYGFVNAGFYSDVQKMIQKNNHQR